MHRKTFMKHEFIGLPIRVTDAADPTLQNVAGTIIDETKNTFLVRNDGTKRVPKHHTTFEIDGTEVRGDDIAYRPEDRIRKIK
ncbi:MAG: ribonuclease P protein subunit [Thermoplasmatota archaeon]